jgi:hypothetical protein
LLKYISEERLERIENQLSQVIQAVGTMQQHVTVMQQNMMAMQNRMDSNFNFEKRMTARVNLACPVISMSEL